MTDMICPVLTRHDGWTEDNHPTTEYQQCGEQVVLTYQTSYVLDTDDLNLAKIEVKDSQSQAWKVECLGGHVLLVSDWQDDNAVFDRTDAEHIPTVRIDNSATQGETAA